MEKCLSIRQILTRPTYFERHQQFNVCFFSPIYATVQQTPVLVLPFTPLEVPVMK